MNVAVVHADDNGARYLLTEDGARKGDIPRFVQVAEPTVFVTIDPSSLLAQLDERFCGDPNWHYTLSRANRELGDITMSKVKLRMFGFRGPGIRHQRMHHCWDPNALSASPLHKFIDETTHETLLEWALDIRSWAESEDLELRNAFAGYASQLLRDPRFYPEPRRKVPRATNEKARPALPGNLVQLYVPPGPTAYNVTAIDQRSAHHRIVQDTPLPDGNTLFARGYYGDPDNAPEYWAKPNTELYNRTVSQPGLLFVGMHSRKTLKGEFRLPIQDYQGFEKRFIWTNQISFLQATGSHIDGIYAAWTSTTIDTGLSRYGAWAQTQIETCSPKRRRWLKPLLHSAYGLLAARPRPLEIGYRQANGGKRADYLLGPRMFQVRSIQLKGWQPVTTNVIQRGMIEAETQIRSLRMAQDLHNAKCRILHIHTDGLHVEGELPLLPDDWAIVGLTSVIYVDRVSWVANEKKCLPGRDHQERQEVIEHYARLHILAAEQRTRGRLRSRLQQARQRSQLQKGS